ncbi:HAD-IA family hydrolase [Paramagnetospirillum magneticum]|uniref:CbbY protein n=1 Tax=Paramagnetospirillum magneticum (strain ATCC 700264 / AMB-1) TaxID=342108 RepID=Q2W981_PARM1|nr:HAD-IA family hydrolase [Paramagnetospirillum magneticum]BAE49594.1 CbbY protein [Paramagnetospirillum magneticum AMB-1]
MMNQVAALIFDVDGTLAETEEAHRYAFNRAFSEAGLNWTWNQETYRKLLKVSGGKERILAFAPDASPELVAGLHNRKNQIYTKMVDSGQVSFRPGVESLISSARAQGLKLAVATTATRANVETLLGARKAFFHTIACAEDVRRKKPDPEVYALVLKRLDLPADKCLVLEDSVNGVTAATTIGLKVVVTPSLYTKGQDFSAAAAVLKDLSGITLAKLIELKG